MSSSVPSPILVTGATGKQGGAVLEALQTLPNPPKLRALSRNPDSPAAQKLKEKGVEVFKGDLSDSEGLKKALEGAEAAFLVTTIAPKGSSEEEQGINFIRVAQSTNLSYLVFTSVCDATPTCTVPHFESKARIEEELRQSGMNHAVVAPACFMDNFPAQSGVALSMLTGVFDASLNGKEIQMISVKDIGEVSAKVVADPSTYAGKVIKLAGDCLTMADVTDIYARLENKSVWKAWIPSLAVSVLPYDFKMMLRWFDSTGFSADIPALRKEFPGLRTFEQYLREAKEEAQ
ncbi:hypothetical protein JCM10207_002446 [Rhodosporidiobolus poonsookiae]